MSYGTLYMHAAVVQKPITGSGINTHGHQCRPELPAFQLRLGSYVHGGISFLFVALAKMATQLQGVTLQCAGLLKFCLAGWAASNFNDIVIL